MIRVIRLTRREAAGLAVGVLLGIVLLAVVAYNVPTPKEPAVKPSPTPKPVYRVIGDDRVLSLWTRDGLGHACPISPTDALTADHIAVIREPVWGPGVEFAPYVVWGDQLGNTGTAQWQW